MDGLHIKSLLVTLIYKYMRELIKNGYLYVAVPPLYRVIYNKNQSKYLQDDRALQKWKITNSSINFELLRFKG